MTISGWRLIVFVTAIMMIRLLPADAAFCETGAGALPPAAEKTSGRDAQPADPDYSYLSEYDGAYPYITLFQDERVVKLLKDLLGDEYYHFMKNMSVQLPMEAMEDGIFASGQAPHSSLSEEAVLFIGYDGRAEAAILTTMNGESMYGDRILYFGSGEELKDFSKGLADWYKRIVDDIGKNIKWEKRGGAPPN